MLFKFFVCLALSGWAGLTAATPGFLLGLDYSEWGGQTYLDMQIATDSSGALYLLAACDYIPCITKLSPDGKTILWKTNLGFIGAMAVDAKGGVYLIPTQSANLFVEKLSADGSSVVWKTQIGAIQGKPVLALDSSGRAFVACYGMSGVVRLNSEGAVDTTIPFSGGIPTGIAVDPTGSNVVLAVQGNQGWSLARFALGGDTWASWPLAQVAQAPALAVDSNGDAIVYGADPGWNWSLRRIDSTGVQVFSKAISGAFVPSTFPMALAPGLALDGAGNAYITGYSGSMMHPVRNTIAPCGSVWLSVFAPDGSLLQTTYIPGASNGQFFALVTVAPNSRVFVLGSAAEAFVPTQTGPFPSGGSYGATALLRLSPTPDARTLPLACVGSAATYGTGPIAPGELVTLFGNGLGPQQGVQTQATVHSPFPTDSANVQVTFGGIPAPLIWVQDSQINAAVPWAVAGPTTQVCAAYNNVKTNCLTWPVAQAAPAVFTVDGVHAAALNQDGTVNSATNPAAPTSIVSVFATGLGPLTPPQRDGSLIGLPLPANSLPVHLDIVYESLVEGSSQIQLSSYDPIYAGPAPYLIGGTTQINFSAIPKTFILSTAYGYSWFFEIYVAAP